MAKTWEEEYRAANRHFEKCICKTLDLKESLDERIAYLEGCYERLMKTTAVTALAQSFKLSSNKPY
jgi:hypothetical protein